MSAENGSAPAMLTPEELIQRICNAPNQGSRAGWCNVLYQHGIAEGLRIAAAYANNGSEACFQHEQDLIGQAQAAEPGIVDVSDIQAELDGRRQ